MDFFKNLFSPFSERAKSPFFGSFIVSWSIINWKILFAILFFWHSDLNGKNLAEFIQSNYLNDIWNPLIFPLTASLIYIFGWTFIDIQIFKFVEERKRKKIDEKIKIGREHNVPGNLYYDLKLGFEEERKKVLEFEDKKKEFVSKIQELENNIVEKESNTIQVHSENKNNKERIQLLQNRHDMKFLQGRWRLSVQPKNKTAHEEDLEILKNEYWIIRGTNRELAFKIELMDYDPSINRISFVKYYDQADEKSKKGLHCFDSLNIIDNDTLEGYENYDIKVSYKRKYFTLLGEANDNILNTWEAKTKKDNPQWADYKEIDWQ